jgi:hypothetical protein
MARKAWEPRYRLILLGLLFFFMACQRQDLNCLVGCFVELSEHTGCGRGSSGCSCVKIEGPPTEAPEYRLSLPAEAAEVLNLAAAGSCDPDHVDLLVNLLQQILPALNSEYAEPGTEQLSCLSRTGGFANIQAVCHDQCTSLSACEICFQSRLQPVFGAAAVEAEGDLGFCTDRYTDGLGSPPAQLERCLVAGERCLMDGDLGPENPWDWMQLWQVAHHAYDFTPAGLLMAYQGDSDPPLLVVKYPDAFARSISDNSFLQAMAAVGREGELLLAKIRDLIPARAGMAYIPLNVEELGVEGEFEVHFDVGCDGFFDVDLVVRLLGLTTWFNSFEIAPGESANDAFSQQLANPELGEDHLISERSSAGTATAATTIGLHIHSGSMQLRFNIAGDIGIGDINDNVTCQARMEAFADLELWDWAPVTTQQGIRLDWAKVYFELIGCSGFSQGTSKIRKMVKEQIEFLLEDGLTAELGFQDHVIVQPLRFADHGSGPFACFRAGRLPLHALGMQAQSRVVQANSGGQVISLIPHVLVWEHGPDGDVLRFERSLEPGISSLAIPIRQLSGESSAEYTIEVTAVPAGSGALTLETDFARPETFNEFHPIVDLSVFTPPHFEMIEIPIIDPSAGGLVIEQPQEPVVPELSPSRVDWLQTTTATQPWVDLGALAKPAYQATVQPDEFLHWTASPKSAAVALLDFAQVIEVHRQSLRSRGLDDTEWIWPELYTLLDQQPTYQVQGPEFMAIGLETMVKDLQPIGQEIEILDAEGASLEYGVDQQRRRIVFDLPCAVSPGGGMVLYGDGTCTTAHVRFRVQPLPTFGIDFEVADYEPPAVTAYEPSDDLDPSSGALANRFDPSYRTFRSAMEKPNLKVYIAPAGSDQGIEMDPWTFEAWGIERQHELAFGLDADNLQVKLKYPNGLGMLPAFKRNLSVKRIYLNNPASSEQLVIDKENDIAALLGQSDNDLMPQRQYTIDLNQFRSLAQNK